mgnify:CR=1 FL=1
MALLPRVSRKDHSGWCSLWCPQHCLWPARIQVRQFDDTTGGQAQRPIRFVERQHLAIGRAQRAAQAVAQVLQAGITAANDQAVQLLFQHSAVPGYHQLTAEGFA